MWVAVTPTLEVYFYKEGYIRTASVPFSIAGILQPPQSQQPQQDGQQPGDVSNSVGGSRRGSSSFSGFPADPFMHLCNNAIQKHGQGYGRFEDGNQLSFNDLQRYIDTHRANNSNSKPISVRNDLVPKFKELISISLHSIAHHIRGGDYSGSTFQLLGYDFMLDENLNPWLIEVNSNPCLEESSSLLKRLIPDMINGVFSLCVDPYYKPRGGRSNSSEQQWKEVSNNGAVNFEYVTSIGNNSPTTTASNNHHRKSRPPVLTNAHSASTLNA